MARTKGAKNKATIAREEALRSTELDIDRDNNITRGGRKVGTVHYVNDMFVAYVGKGVEFRSFDLDALLDDIKATVVF